MAHGWSIAGRRVELAAGWPAGKLQVKHQGQVEHELKLGRQGDWQLPVGDQTFSVKRTRTFMGPKTELLRADGAKVPPSAVHASPHPAASGSVCPGHQAAARYACARCGGFCCERCAGADLTHCEACCAKLLETAEKNAAAMAYFAPVIVFAIIGGLLAALFGALAGAAAVAVARRTESKVVKVLAAVVLYTVAVAAWAVAVAYVRR